MKSLLLKNKYITVDLANSQNIIADIKDYIREYECEKLTIDLKNLNPLDAARIIVMTSTFHNKKYPEGKVTCKAQSAIKNFLSFTSTKNLEFVT